MVVVALKIKNEDWPVFSKFFCLAHPNQTTDLPNPMSDDDWVKHRILLFALGSYKKGFRQEYEQQNLPNFVLDIISL